MNENENYLRCYYCKNRGATTDRVTGDGVKHYCWCHLDRVQVLHDLFGKACKCFEMGAI